MGQLTQAQRIAGVRREGAKSWREIGKRGKLSLPRGFLSKISDTVVLLEEKVRFPL